MQEVSDTIDPLSALELIARSTPTAKGVLLLLLVFSIVSWAIIFTKFFIFRKAREQDKMFIDFFSKSESLNNICNFSKGLKYSPVARVFLTGYNELYVYREVQKSPNGNPGDKTGLTTKDLKGINLALNKSINREIERLSGKLDFLATTGSTAPFIGLFGTVWGIMHSFRLIGLKGSASIGGVAPGIAEALIATAAGLVAAIPAVVFFNYLNAKIRGFSHRMEDFSEDFLFMVEKNFMKESSDPVRID